MIKLIQSGWFGMFLGGTLYLAVTTVIWPKSPPKPPPQSEETEAEPETEAASLNYGNPEIDELMSELRLRREALEAREVQLKAWETRLQAERSELNVVTQLVSRVQADLDQTISRAQADLDKSVLRIRADEMANLKRLAKTYNDMSPQAAGAILKNQDDETVAKLLLLMKDSEVAVFLEQLAKQGDAEAKRASLLTERIRMSVPPGKTK